MTLIITHLSKFGIVHASDSNLTNASGAAGTAKKTFELPHINAGMTVSGSYSVGGQRMDLWLDTFIQSHMASNSPSLFSFANSLKCSLENEMFPEEKDGGSIVHIAGYVEANGKSHPEFYSVRNVHGIVSATGEYKKPRNDFACVEEFWSIDGPRGDLLAAFERGDYQIYINGFAHGRMSYLVISNLLQQVFDHLWQQPGWQFRRPKSLEETKVFVETNLFVINALFKVSNYTAPFIGGPIQIYGIPRPANAVTDF